MRPAGAWFGRAGAAVAVSGLVSLVLTPSLPLLDVGPARDSGVFVYTAWRILNGAIPYRDVWDHKMPAIFYLDAVGLVLGRGSYLGVLGLEWIALAAAAVLSLLALRQAFGTAAAWVGTFLWLTSLALILEGGNLAEEFALPLQFLALGLFLRSGGRGGSLVVRLVLGLSAGVAFSLRQNLVGVWLAILAYRALAAWREGSLRREVVQALPIVAAFALAQVPWLVYLSGNGALAAFWDAAFVYSAGYSNAGWDLRLAELVFDLALLSATGFSIVGLLGWLTAVSSTWVRHTATQSNTTQAALGLIIIGMPIELVLSSISGRLLPHHAITALPILSLAAGRFLQIVLRRGSARPYVSALRAAAVALLTVLVFRDSLANALQRSADLTASIGRQTATEYVRASVPGDASVLFWGAEASVNFQAQRPAPTKFVYQYPLFAGWYRTPAMVSEFFADLHSQPPALIVDTSPVEPAVMPLDPTNRAVWLAHDPWGPQPLPVEFETGLRWIAANYEPSATLPIGWRVYTPRNLEALVSQAH